VCVTLALYFRELRPAVSEEKKESRRDGDFLQLDRHRVPTVKMAKSSKQISFMLGKCLHLLVLCTSRSSMSAKPFGQKSLSSEGAGGV
jgi:hypothetical protein